MSIFEESEQIQNFQKPQYSERSAHSSKKTPPVRASGHRQDLLDVQTWAFSGEILPRNMIFQIVTLQ